VVLPVCYRQIVQLGDTSTNYQVLPGDRIYVPSMTLHDDIKQICMLGRDEICPRCAGRQTPCIQTECGRASCARCSHR
jgi:polysaccharide export outer membrane protein